MMLTITEDLSAFTLAAGEPFILDLQWRDPDGAVVPLTGRAFVLSLHDPDRAVREAIVGEPLSDGQGDHVRFARDGRLSESLYGWPLTIELAERYRHGREVIARGSLTILPSAEDVASLDAARIAAWAQRVTITAGRDGATPAFTQTRIPFTGEASAPVLLQPLSLPATTMTVGTVIDLAIAGTMTGSTVTATAPPGLSIANGRITGTPTVAGTPDLILVETLAGAANSPRTTRIALTIVAAPVLGALTLSVALESGTVATGTITGATAGSRLTTTLAGLTIDSAARRFAFDGSAAAGATGSLVETLAGAAGSPRTTALSVAAPVVADVILSPHRIGPVDLGAQTAVGFRAMDAEPYMIGARFRRATNTVDFWFRMVDAGNGFIFRLVDDDHYRLIHVVDGRQSDIGGYVYRSFLFPLVAAPDSALLELRVATDGSATLYQDGVPVSERIEAAFLDGIQPQRGSGIRFTVTIGPAMAVTTGSLAPPLAIRGATVDPATRTIDLAIAYVGSPDRYEYRVDGGGWSAARTLSSARTGEAVLRVAAPAGAGSVTVALRQHDAPDIRASIAVVL
jgi:hypothetical protein